MVLIRSEILFVEEIKWLDVTDIIKAFRNNQKLKLDLLIPPDPGYMS